MKKSYKIISTALALIMGLSVLILPASAATKPAFDMAVKFTPKLAGKTVAGEDVYKISVNVDSNTSLLALEMNITWDDKVFTPVNPLNFEREVPFSRMSQITDKKDPEVIMNADNNADLPYANDFGFYSNDATGGFADFLCTANPPNVAGITDTNMGPVLKAKGYTGAYWQWMVNFNSPQLLISGGKIAPTKASPYRGAKTLFSFYLKVKSTAPNGVYTVGAHPEQAFRFTGAYTWADDIDSKSFTDQKSSIPPESNTYELATITVGAPVVAGPAVASHKSEIRFNGTKPTPTSFDYRITSKILQADWDKYFTGTQAGAATNAITKVGAVAFDPAKGGTFDLAQAKAVAKAGASSGSYGYGSTTYIQKTATDAFFGCIIPGLTHTANNQDMQVLGFVEYKDATGTIQYIFYDAAATAAVNSKYDTALALWNK